MARKKTANDKKKMMSVIGGILLLVLMGGLYWYMNSAKNLGTETSDASNGCYTGFQRVNIDVTCKCAKKSYKVSKVDGCAVPAKTCSGKTRLEKELKALENEVYRLNEKVKETGGNISAGDARKLQSALSAVKTYRSRIQNFVCPAAKDSPNRYSYDRGYCTKYCAKVEAPATTGKGGTGKSACQPGECIPGKKGYQWNGRCMEVVNKKCR